VENLGTVTLECEEVAARLSRGLSEAGLQVTRSFDLQSARQTLREPETCPCPHHGTTDCTCQYVVLLVGGAPGSPLTLVAHGHDGRTHVSIEGAGQAYPELVAAVRAAVGRDLMPASTLPGAGPA
jgi:hypothetical protein